MDATKRKKLEEALADPTTHATAIQGNIENIIGLQQCLIEVLDMHTALVCILIDKGIVEDEYLEKIHDIKGRKILARMQ
jgi:hypothetical protein